MDNVRLLSESFESAAYALQHALDVFARQNSMSSDVDRFCRATDDFRITVDRFVDAVEKLEKKL